MKSFSWKLYHTTPTTGYAITNREPGSVVKVRVKAENAAGMSEPSDKVVVELPKVTYY